MMKKLKLLAATLLSGALLFAAVPAGVAFDPLGDVCSGSGGSSAPCQTTSGRSSLIGPDGIITKVTRLVSIAVGLIAVIVIMIAGFRFITSSGDPNTITSARNTILYAVIGLVIAVIAQLIVVFILQRL